MNGSVSIYKCELNLEHFTDFIQKVIEVCL